MPKDSFYPNTAEPICILIREMYIKIYKNREKKYLYFLSLLSLNGLCPMPKDSFYPNAAEPIYIYDNLWNVWLLLLVLKTILFLYIYILLKSYDSELRLLKSKKILFIFWSKEAGPIRRIKGRFWRPNTNFTKCMTDVGTPHDWCQAVKRGRERKRKKRVIDL